MGIQKVAEGAYFVPSYSVQMLARSYDVQTTILSLGPESNEIVEPHTPSSFEEPNEVRPPNASDPRNDAPHAAAWHSRPA
jgi:hypothetical protein